MDGSLSVLVVDDDPILRRIATEMLEQDGCVVHRAENGAEALRRLGERATDVVVLDMLMPEKEGLETLIEIRQAWPGVRVVAISGGGRIGAAELLQWATVAGADAVLAKPLDPRLLCETVRAVVRNAADA